MYPHRRGDGRQPRADVENDRRGPRREYYRHQPEWEDYDAQHEQRMYDYERVSPNQVISSPTRGRVELPPPLTRGRLADDERFNLTHERDHGPLDDIDANQGMHGYDDADLAPGSPTHWAGPEQEGYEDADPRQSPIYGGTEWRDANFQQRAFHEGGPDIMDLYLGGEEHIFGPRGFRGRGPIGYRRAPDRVTDDIIELLTDHPRLDASAVDVDVDSDGIVTLSGFVASRREKCLAEDCCDRVRGVRDVRNALEIDPGLRE